MRNVIKRVMVVLMTLCILLGMTPISAQAATKTVTYKAYKTENTELIVLLKNNTKKEVGVEITVKYYNEAGEEVGKVTETVYDVYGNCEYAQEIYAPMTEAYETIIYSKYKVSVKAIKAVPYGINTSKITGKASYNKKDESLDVKIKNNGKEVCSAYYTLLFFKGKNFTGTMGGSTDIIQPKATDEASISIPTNEKGTNIKYDSIKIIINTVVLYDENQEGY